MVEMAPKGHCVGRLLAQGPCHVEALSRAIPAYGPSGLTLFTCPILRPGLAFTLP